MNFLDYLYGWFYFSAKKVENGYNDPENSALALLLIFFVLNCVSGLLLVVLFTNISDFVTLQKERDLLIIFIVYVVVAFLSRRYFIKSGRYKRIVIVYNKDNILSQILVYSYLFLSISLLIISAFLMIPSTT